MLTISFRVYRQHRFSFVFSLNMDAGNAEPVLESVFPTLGPTRGSTVVTITGSNFVDGSTVCRAGHVSWSVASCSSSMECVCTIPAHSQGRFPLTVSADGGLTFSKDSVAFMFYCTHSFLHYLFSVCALCLTCLPARSRKHRLRLSDFWLRIRSNNCSSVWIELY